MTDDRQAIANKLQDIEKVKVFNELDFRITETEVHNAIKALKSGKATGLDNTSNEMLKAGQSVLSPILAELFNKILNSGNYPKEWASGRILSLHKKGNTADPGNYRGITISSCLGKLFNSVLNTRLYSFLEKNELIPREQIGFKKGHRTADHIFIIRHLIDYYKQRRKPLYFCFVDFRQAFDSVWHTGLLFKIANLGISSNVYNVIKNMYQKISLCIQSGLRVSPFFSSSIGVRQGDNLSPTLFNIFLHDLPAKLGADCQPATFGEMSISSLLYADDLVLLSETENGLQELLKRLHEYASLWALEVNTLKTKCLYIGPKRPVGTKISCQFGNNPIEEEDTYSYLGITISNEVLAKSAKQDMYNKGLKAYFKLLRSFKVQPKVKTMTHLFDHLIKPILLYGSEVFGLINFKSRELKHSDDPKTQFFQQIKQKCPIISAYINAEDPLEKLHLKFCRRILQVHSKTTNIGVYGELGRAPLFIAQVVSAMKYFYHLKFSSENRLLEEFFSNVTEMQNHSFIKSVETIHSLTGMRMPLNIKEANRSIDYLKRHLSHEFQVYWRLMLNTDFAKGKVGNNKLIIPTGNINVNLNARSTWI